MSTFIETTAARFRVFGEIGFIIKQSLNRHNNHIHSGSNKRHSSFLDPMLFTAGDLRRATDWI